MRSVCGLHSLHALEDRVNLLGLRVAGRIQAVVGQGEGIGPVRQRRVCGPHAVHGDHRPVDSRLTEQPIIMQGEQRRSHPPGLNSGPHRVVPCPPREDIRRVGGEAELHRHQLPEGVLGIAGIAIGGNQRLSLCLIPEKGSGAGVYAAEGLRGQVIVRILLPDVAVDKDHGGP